MGNVPEKEIRRLVEEGKGISKIARILGLSHGTTQRTIESLGLKTKGTFHTKIHHPEESENAVLQGFQDYEVDTSDLTDGTRWDKHQSSLGVEFYAYVGKVDKSWKGCFRNMDIACYESKRPNSGDVQDFLEGKLGIFKSRKVLFDKGSEFKPIQRLLRLQGSTIIRVPTQDGKAKPHIEGLFGDLKNHWLIHRMPEIRVSTPHRRLEICQEVLAEFKQYWLGTPIDAPLSKNPIVEPQGIPIQVKVCQPRTQVRE